MGSVGGLAKTSICLLSPDRKSDFGRPAVHCFMGAIASDLPKNRVVAPGAASTFASTLT
jgi:hypothetical protein